MYSNISVDFWGYHENKIINAVKISNSSAAYVEIINYGATIVNIVVPDRKDNMESVVLGYNCLKHYKDDEFYIGSTIGRYANRISNAKINVGDGFYQLDRNNGNHSNHGGFSGYHKRVFDMEIIKDGVRMQLVDKDGIGGYPGTINLTITFIWTEKNELKINYNANTDKATIANFTNHSYFDLSGRRDLILQNRLWIDSKMYLESDDNHLPTGNILNDNDGFINGRILHELIDSLRPIQTGINKYFIFDKNKSANSVKAELYDQNSGRRLRISTSYPGIMIYTAHYLDVLKGREGFPYKPFSAICLECQHYPDAINYHHFPSPILYPDVIYNESIKFKFDIQ